MTSRHRNTCLPLRTHGSYDDGDHDDVTNVVHHHCPRRPATAIATAPPPPTHAPTKCRTLNDRRTTKTSSSLSNDERQTTTNVSAALAIIRCSKQILLVRARTPKHLYQAGTRRTEGDAARRRAIDSVGGGGGGLRPRSSQVQSSQPHSNVIYFCRNK